MSLPPTDVRELLRLDRVRNLRQKHEAQVWFIYLGVNLALAAIYWTLP